MRPTQPPKPMSTPKDVYAQGNTSQSPAHEGARLQDAIDANGPLSQEREPLGDGEQRARRLPGEVLDSFYLSAEDKEEYGMQGAIPSCLADTNAPGDKVYVCMAAPSVYGKVDPAFVRRKKLRNRSLEIPKDKDGNPFYAAADLIYATIDRKEYLEKLAHHNEACGDFTRSLIQGSIESKEAESGLIEDFRGSDPKFLWKKYNEARTQLATLKDKWPRSMTLEAIERHMGAEYTERLERKYARNGRTERPGEYEAYATSQRESAKKSKGKSFSFPGQATK